MSKTSIRKIFNDCESISAPISKTYDRNSYSVPIRKITDSTTCSDKIKPIGKIYDSTIQSVPTRPIRKIYDNNKHSDIIPITKTYPYSNTCVNDTNHIQLYYPTIPKRKGKDVICANIPPLTEFQSRAREEFKQARIRGDENINIFWTIPKPEPNPNAYHDLKEYMRKIASLPQFDKTVHGQRPTIEEFSEMVKAVGL
jgi:hypothetical protein